MLCGVTDDRGHFLSGQGGRYWLGGRYRLGGGPLVGLCKFSYRPLSDVAGVHKECGPLSLTISLWPPENIIFTSISNFNARSR